MIDTIITQVTENAVELSVLLAVVSAILGILQFYLGVQVWAKIKYAVVRMLLISPIVLTLIVFWWFLLIVFGLEWWPSQVDVLVPYVHLVGLGLLPSAPFSAALAWYIFVYRAADKTLLHLMWTQNGDFGVREFDDDEWSEATVVDLEFDDEGAINWDAPELRKSALHRVESGTGEQAYEAFAFNEEKNKIAVTWTGTATPTELRSYRHRVDYLVDDLEEIADKAIETVANIDQISRQEARKEILRTRKERKGIDHDIPKESQTPIERAVELQAIEDQLGERDRDYQQDAEEETPTPPEEYRESESEEGQ
ncbi:hypothetical protein EXE51_05320 [Halorubrum sp. CGM5_25_10-8B]|uniref:hypothetical protein n=1 Tax=Halorubrum sp. CGM5_25_10-8B TaxID=2518115 RepID=UPI0010F6D9AC|nr:hypothetical protein [Halorubrum sp. CGM5_25_10-8B]TKX38011.1 hypothetical protein EXE51_05320 [Halorubrum sp. CGM5_25_10-8B]